MGFDGYDDIISKATVSGQYSEDVWQKVGRYTTAPTQNNAVELFTAIGCPASGTWSGTAGTSFTMAASTTGALYLNANVAPKTRHLINISGGIIGGLSSSTPTTLILCDFLLYYPSLVVTGTPTTITNNTTLPRYTDGVGVQCIMAVQTLLGAAQPNLTITYVDSNNNTRTTSLISPKATGANVGWLFQNTSTAAFTSMFLPSLDGAKGVKSITSYTIASGTTGTVCAILVKPLMQLSINTSTTAISKKELLNQYAALPKIEDQACLGFIQIIGCSSPAVNTPLFGTIKYIWG